MRRDEHAMAYPTVTVPTAVAAFPFEPFLAPSSWPTSARSSVSPGVERQGCIDCAPLPAITDSGSSVAAFPSMTSG